METSQQCVLELALRFFPIESDSRLTERHLQHFDWLMSKSLSEWQYLGFVDQRPRRGAFVPPIFCFLFTFVFVDVRFLFVTCNLIFFCLLFFYFFCNRMNPGFARYRNHFDLPSARFLWFSESGIDIFFPEDPIWPDEELEFPPMNRLNFC
jgi:hypothetical protein